MRWEPDVSRGDWLHARLDRPDARPWTIHMMVPRGFPRYARIFHPVRRATDPWDAAPCRGTRSLRHVVSRPTR